MSLSLLIDSLSLPSRHTLISGIVVQRGKPPRFLRREQQSAAVWLDEPTSEMARERWFLGSISKLFTALVATMHADAVDAELERQLPLRAAPLRTVRALASHTSRLPRLPPTMNWFHLIWHRNDPYASLSTEQLWRDALKLSSAATANPTEHVVEYSNFGAMLLGCAVKQATGSPSFADLVHTEVLRPLQMNSTSFLVDDKCVNG